MDGEIELEISFTEFEFELKNSIDSLFIEYRCDSLYFNFKRYLVYLLRKAACRDITPSNISKMVRVSNF